MPLIPVTVIQSSAEGWTKVLKLADESVDTNTTPQNDDEIFFQTENGGVYDYWGGLIYASPVGGTAPDLKTAWGEDATARGLIAGFGISNTDVEFTGLAQTNQTGTMIYGTATTDRHVRLTGIHVGAGGIFRMLWAQNASSPNATVVRAGTFLYYRRIN